MSSELDGISRREALWRLLGGVAVAHERRTAASDVLLDPSPRQAGLMREDRTFDPMRHPRTYLTPTALVELRAQLGRDVAFRARWQTAVSQFESAGGAWNSSGVADNAYTMAFAALLACVRRPDDDLGMIWATPWRAYRDRVVGAVQGWRHDGSYAPQAWATGLIYDLLYHDLTADERDRLSAWTKVAADRCDWVKFHWDDQSSDDHVAKVICSMASDDAKSRLDEVLAQTRAWAQSRAWMAYASGLGYEWKDGTPASIGPVIALHAIRNAARLSAEDTTDLYLPVLRDGWQLVRQLVIPHPACVAGGRGLYWLNDRVNMTAPTAPLYHRTLPVGTHLVWALALLPGHGLPERFFEYLQHVWTEPNPRAAASTLRGCINFKYVRTGPSTKTQANSQAFYSFVPWLILNAQERKPCHPAEAGISRVRRWWPGTLDWTTVRSDFTDTHASLITYHHRKYFVKAYEEGCRQNGSWHVHRAGPLLVQRGTASHSVIGRKYTWPANGTVTFPDAGRPEYAESSIDKTDGGNVRQASTSSTRSEVLSKRDSDYGDVTAWHADAGVVAISSNLLRSYNSTAVATYGNAVKISDFTREFVCVQRGADGTDHERVFTYDRIILVGDGQFEPRYNLCPAADPAIDGRETAYTPWHPQATGPTRWDYLGATRMIFDNVTEPQARPAGNGRVCLTWLRPSGTGVRVLKRGGTNLTLHPDRPQVGAPFFGPYGEPIKANEWEKLKGLDKRAYAGLYTVSIIPVPVTADTRFLIACDVMAATETPDVAAELGSDTGSVAASCGASAVVFSKEAMARSKGSVTLPSDVSLVVLLNLPPGQERVLAATKGLGITTRQKVASNTGVLTVGVSGGGVLEFG